MKKLLCVVLVCVGCTPESPEPVAVLDLPDPSPVVATVGGKNVHASEVREYWARNPEMEREQVMAALVERELLLAAAMRRRAEFERSRLSFAKKQGLVMAVVEEYLPSKGRSDSLGTLLQDLFEKGEVKRFPSVIEAEMEEDS